MEKDGEMTEKQECSSQAVSAREACPNSGESAVVTSDSQSIST